MSPPGKTSGSTTKESVVKASRSPRASRLGGQSRLVLQRRQPLVVERATKTSSMRSRIALPPPPWASVMVAPHLSRGLRLRIDGPTRGRWSRALPANLRELAAVLAGGSSPRHHMVVGGAGALRRHHQRAERRLGRAGLAEHLAVQGLMTPFSTSPHWQDLGSAIFSAGTENFRSASKAA